MTNLNVKSSLPSPSPAASVAANSGAADIQSGKTFGDVLKQQVSENQSSIPLESAQHAPVAEKKVLAEKDSPSGKTEDTSDAAPPPASAGLSADLIALLQPLQQTDTSKQAQVATAEVSAKTSASKPLAAGLVAGRADTNIEKALTAIGLDKQEEIQNGKRINAKQLTTDLLKSTEHSDLPSPKETLPSQFAQVQSTALLNASDLSQAATLAQKSNLENSRNSITTPVGADGWGDEFTQKISWMSTSQLDQVAELHLNPPNLGPLDVVLKISDNQATATFTSAHSAVREAVESALPKLRELLADNGITLGNTTVSDQAPREGNASTFGGRQSPSQGGRWVSQTSADTLAPAPSALPRTVGVKHKGMVDTFA